MEGLIPKDVDGLREVDHEEKEHSLDPRWLKEGVKTAFSARTYIKNCVERLEHMTNQTFGTFQMPMSEILHPEMDDSPLCSPTNHSKFRSLVGCANWLITLGRFDIAYATNALSRFSAAPREGHLRAMTCVFECLKT